MVDNLFALFSALDTLAVSEFGLAVEGESFRAKIEFFIFLNQSMHSVTNIDIGKSKNEQGHA